MTVDIWTQTFIEDFSEEDIKNFQEIVLKDVRNQLFNQEQKDILFNNLDLWLFSLRVLRRDIELKLSQIKVNTKIKIQELKDSGSSTDEIDRTIIAEQVRKNNTKKFLSHVESKTLYVKLLIDQELEKIDE